MAVTRSIAPGFSRNGVNLKRAETMSVAASRADSARRRAVQTLPRALTGVDQAGQTRGRKGGRYKHLRASWSGRLRGRIHHPLRVPRAEPGARLLERAGN